MIGSGVITGIIDVSKDTAWGPTLGYGEPKDSDVKDYKLNLRVGIELGDKAGLFV